MNTQTVKASPRRFIVAASLLLFLSAVPVFSQDERATSRQGLAATGYMTSPEVSDDLDGTNDEYFYKFLAGPGKLTVILEVVANETNAGATLDLFGANSRAILSNILAQGVDGSSERVSRSITLAKAQEIVIRIKGMKYGSSAGYPGIYKIRLEGPAARFADAGPAMVPGPEKGPELPQPAAPDPDKVPEVPQSAATGNKPEAAPTDGTDQAKESNDLPSDAAAPNEKPASAPSNKSSKGKKTEKVESAIDKATTKSQKLLDLIEKVKPKKP